MIETRVTHSRKADNIFDGYNRGRHRALRAVHALAVVAHAHGELPISPLSR